MHAGETVALAQNTAAWILGILSIVILLTLDSHANSGHFCTEAWRFPRTRQIPFLPSKLRNANTNRSTLCCPAVFHNASFAIRDSMVMAFF
ncbi:MAG: hypothetical protein JXM79_00615 [Sedimentisphaerales bacterium]|nr:hypothetical protein [Sedimentisphaerales bacterium]